MHLLAARPGGFVDDGGQGVVRVAQTPGEIVILSAADTTLSLLAETVERLPADAPNVRLAHLLWLRQPASVDCYVDEMLTHARAIVIDHLGAPSDWSYLVDRVTALAWQQRQWVALFSGDGQEDPELLRRSTADSADCRLLWRYLREGGAINAERFFALIFHRVWGRGELPPPPEPVPPVFRYHPKVAPPPVPSDAPHALLLFYRAHALASNTTLFDQLIGALHAEGLRVSALAVDSLKSPVTQEALATLAKADPVDIVLNTTAFALGNGEEESAGLTPWVGDAPVLQLITVGTALDRWRDNPHGLTPRDQAMQVVLPEVDGRIITRPVSGKGSGGTYPRSEIEVARYEPLPDRIAFVAELTRRWCALRRKPPAEQRLALLLANYPGDDARIGHAVGLDTPASLLTILTALRGVGYRVGELPPDPQTLIAALQAGVTHDLATNPLRPAGQSLALPDYQKMLSALPLALVEAVNARWGPPEADPLVRQGRIMIPGLRLGNMFVGIQPPRGRGIDYARTYHDAELVPPHAYLAFYFWLRHYWQVDAVVHVGKHGNLEWLPGKSVALSSACWPDAVLGPTPHLYPFIVNDPGEGCQAKRRAHAVIIDHLMPPLTRAETYGPLQAIERLMDEYYEALLLDPPRARRVRERLLSEALQQKLHLELGLPEPRSENDRNALLQRLEAYLCEIKETQIRNGIHRFGQSPKGRARAETLAALVRFPRGSAPGEASMLRALAADLGLPADYDPLQAEPTTPWNGPRPAALQTVSDRPWRHAGHTRERLEALALLLLEHPEQVDPTLWPRTAAVLTAVEQQIAPRLDASGANEIAQLLAGLRGRFVPPGPSGAPSRGRADVLPTGRNFYAVDPRALPTPTAWSMGEQAAQRLIERYVQEHGCYPTGVGLSLWGTSTMRTAGEEIAQALALLGVRPSWAEGSHRVIDIEVLPIGYYDRPRIDVTLRISGFFRDAFPGLIELFDAAVQAVAAIPANEEPDELNPIRARIEREAAAARAAGCDEATARRRASWRIFGPAPGNYRTGVQELIESGCWQQPEELAEAYLTVSAFAYGQGAYGVAARGSLEARLIHTNVVLHNQDNREHDLLDSDGYYPFLGGMVVAVTRLRSQAPARYHSDLSTPGAPRVRPLAEELARVVRARVVNPKWIAAMQQHGYKGAMEMANTVDLLFGFAATTGDVPNHHFALVADAYLFDPTSHRFLEAHNPHALRAIGLRLLEAIERGLWRDDQGYEERLRTLLLAHEARLEAPPGA